MFFNSSNQPPTPVPTRNPPSLATHHLQSKTSQQNHQNESKTKGGGGKQRQSHLQHKNTNIPPITKLSSCPICCPISQIEANHRHLLIEFADWIKRPKQAPLPTTSPTTYRYATQNPRTSTNNGHDPTVIYSRTKHPPELFQTDSSRNKLQSQFLPKQQPAAMPTDTIANAWLFRQ